MGCHFLLQCVKAKSESEVSQSCPTRSDPMECSLPGSRIPGILQARTLEWVAISLSNAWKWKVKVKSLSHVWLLVTPRTASYQAPSSMGFSRQEYWSGLPLKLNLRKFQSSRYHSEFMALIRSANNMHFQGPSDYKGLIWLGSSLEGKNWVTNFFFCYNYIFQLNHSFNGQVQLAFGVTQRGKYSPACIIWVWCFFTTLLCVCMPVTTAPHKPDSSICQGSFVAAAFRLVTFGFHPFCMWF